MSALTQRNRPAACLSDFVLDQIVAGVLEGDQAAPRAREHLAQCARCSERLAGFERVEVPPLPKTARPPRAKRFLAVCGTAAGLLVVLAGVVGPLWRHPSEPGASPTRAKGAIALGVIARRNSGAIERLAAGESVAPGDALRFQVSTAQSGFVAVLGLDAAGNTTAYAPFAGSTLELSSGGPVVLPGSVIADETLGAERIIALVCPKPRSVAELGELAARALERVGKDPRRVTTLGAGCAEATFDIEKRSSP